MQDVHVKVNRDKSCIQQEDDTFQQQTGLKFKEETKEILHFEHNFVWY